MAGPVLHIVFNSSGAAGLRTALRQAGRSERVISLSDCLSFGPINPPDPELRSKWVETELAYTDWNDVSEATSFWPEALSISSRRIAWLSRRSAQEYAGFLEWLWRLGDAPIEVIDLTDVMVAGYEKGPTKPHLAISLGILPPHQIIDNDLLDRAETLTPAFRGQYRTLWGRLRFENAPLRVVSGGELVSAPLSLFDPLLLSCATPEWQRAAAIVGLALADFWTTSVLQTGDLVLCARVRALVATGCLESRGDPFDIQNCELRLPVSQSSGS